MLPMSVMERGTCVKQITRPACSEDGARLAREWFADSLPDATRQFHPLETSRDLVPVSQTATHWGFTDVAARQEGVRPLRCDLSLECNKERGGIKLRGRSVHHSGCMVREHRSKSLVASIVDLDGIDRRLILRNLGLTKHFFPASAILSEEHKTLQPQAFICFLQMPATNRDDVFREPDGQLTPFEGVSHQVSVWPTLPCAVQQKDLYRDLRRVGFQKRIPTPLFWTLLCGTGRRGFLSFWLSHMGRSDRRVVGLAFWL